MIQEKIIIYQAEDGQVQIDIRFEKETVWLSQAKMAILFDKDVRTINEHVKNIFTEGELVKNPTIRNFQLVRQEGKREVRRNIEHYNLDMIISVGYRVNSKKGTQFRIWATARLKELLLQGYSLHQQRFEQNAKALQQALKLIEKTAKSPNLTLDAGRGLTEIVSRYTQTFLWLQRYDEGLLEEPQGQTGGDLATPEQAMQSLISLKQSLIERREAT
ncbi:virulence RhuM family protein [Beggiatoa alba]|nr:virulence RhuM family protein [Beggiatoa alba]